MAAEQHSNFAPYSQSKAKGNKGPSWTVKLVCLSSKDAYRVPCSVAEREALVQAGLGEKKVVIPDVNCSAEEFKAMITAAFPKLQGCGGFELLRCIPNSKEMEVISPTVSQSPRLLKSVVGSGRVFIRPIQQDLQMDIDTSLPTSAEVMICEVIVHGTQ